MANPQNRSGDGPSYRRREPVCRGSALACSLLTDNPMQWAVWIATAGLWSQALGSGACP